MVEHRVYHASRLSRRGVRIEARSRAVADAGDRPRLALAATTTASARGRSLRRTISPATVCYSVPRSGRCSTFRSRRPVRRRIRLMLALGARLGVTRANGSRGHYPRRRRCRGGPRPSALKNAIFSAEDSEPPRCCAMAAGQRRAGVLVAARGEASEVVEDGRRRPKEDRETTNPMRAGARSSKFPMRVPGAGVTDADADDGITTARIARRRMAR